MSVLSSITFRLNAFVIGLLMLSALGVAAVGGTLPVMSFETPMRSSTFPALMDAVAGMVDQDARTLETLSGNPFFTEWVAAGGNKAQTAQSFAMGRERMHAHGTGGMDVVLVTEDQYGRAVRQHENSPMVYHGQRSAVHF